MTLTASTAPLGVLTASDGPGAAVPPVVITTLGASFSPSVSLAAGSSATVTWTWAGGSATGLAPAISFGSSGTRAVQMTVAGPNGQGLEQVTVFNVGFTYSQDTGTYSPAASYNWPAQSISGIAGIAGMTGLTLFLAGNIATLTGTLDFTGLAALTNIECYQSGVQAVVTAGCTALRRMVVETDNLTSVDAGTVAGSLYEFRLASQRGGSLAFSPALAVPFASLYHFCVRDQAVTGMPSMATRLPVVKELWIWNTGQSGALAPSSTALTNVQAYGNGYTSAAFTAPAFSGSSTYLDLHANSLASVALPAANGLSFVDLHSNLLPAAQVNAVLQNLAANSISGGTVNLGGTGNAAPNGAGLTAVTTLRGRGWTVTVNSGGSNFTHQDTAYGSSASGTSLPVTLAASVSAGDLLVLYVATGGAPLANISVTDSAGNTWVNAYNGQLWYCAGAAAHSGALTVTAAVTGAFYVHQVIADRFTPAGAVTLGGTANTGGSGTLGLNYNGTGCGDLGTVPASALAWGAFSVDDASGTQSYSPGFQTGTTAPADVIGSQFTGAAGTGLSAYVTSCVNQDATLTWYGTGTGAIGHAVSAWFTSA